MHHGKISKRVYCTFYKHMNFEVQNLPSLLRFLLLSIVIRTTSNEPWNTETHKINWNPPFTDHKPWPFEPVVVKFCFLRGPLRWLTAAKNANVSCLLNFRVPMFLKSAVTGKNSLAGLCHVHCKPVSIVSHIFLWIFMETGFTKFHAFKKAFCNQISAVPREIHTPPGNKY